MRREPDRPEVRATRRPPLLRVLLRVRVRQRLREMQQDHRDRLQGNGPFDPPPPFRVNLIQCCVRRTCPTRTSTGTRPASCAPPAGNPWSTSSSAPKATGSTADAATTNNSPPDATAATRSSGPVGGLVA